MFDLNYRSTLPYWRNLRQIFQETTPEKTLMERMGEKTLHLILTIKMVFMAFFEKCYKVATNPFMKNVGMVILDVTSEIFVYIILGVCCIIIALVIQAHKSLQDKSTTVMSAAAAAATVPVAKKPELPPVEGGDEPFKDKNDDYARQ